MADILARIETYKRAEIAAAKAAVPESELSPMELARRVEALRQVAEVRFAQGDLEAAREIAERSCDLAEALARIHPSAEHERSLALAHTMLGSIRNDLDIPEQASESFAAALVAARRAVTAAPDDPSYRRLLAATLSDTGVGLKALGRATEAIERFGESETILRELIDAHALAGDAKAERAAVSELATVLAWRSTALEESGQLAAGTAARPGSRRWSACTIRTARIWRPAPWRSSAPATTCRS